VRDLGHQRSGPVEVVRAGDAGFQHITAEPVLELGGGALRDHAACVDHDDPVCKALCLLHVLRREQHGRAGGDEVFDEPPDVVARAWVKAGGRLIEEQDPWAADQARAHVKAPAHPARVGLDELFGGIGEREALQHLLGSTAVLALFQMVEEPDELEVLPAGQQFIDGRELAGQTDHRPQPARVVDDVAARHVRPAAVGLQQGGQNSHQRRLARAVGSQQREHLALLSNEVNVSQRLRGPEPLGHRLDLDQR